jgi:adenylate kinase
MIMETPALAETSRSTLNNVVVVTGVSASGKDYLLDRVTSRLDSENETYRKFSFGAMIHDIMRRKHPGTYDGPLGLREAPEGEMDASSGEALEAILAVDGLRIVNCHVVYRGAESIQVNPYHVFKMCPRDYIVISSDPNEILRRRIECERFRIKEDVRVIDLHQKIGIATIKIAAQSIGARVTLIDNTEELTDTNVSSIHKIVKGGSDG